jgi:hypothetical protein
MDDLAGAESQAADRAEEQVVPRLKDAAAKEQCDS